MATEPQRLTGKRAGIVGSLVLASSTVVAMLHLWENPAKDANVVYADKLAGGLPTACGGVTKHVTDEPIIVGDVWSDEKCDFVLRKILVQGQVKLAECFNVPLSQNTFDAFTVMAHNVGVGNVCASKAVGLVNAHKLAEGCRAIAFTPDDKPNWSSTRARKKDGTVVTTFVQGLHNRRIAEMKLCLKP